MNLLALSWKYIRSKPLSNFLNVTLITLGVGLTSLLLLLNSQFRDRLYKNIEPIHLVVSAKGSPLQMILSSVYHVDIPTGNISTEKAYLLTKNFYVEKAIPLALGDSYKTFRIVGTTTDYIDLYKGNIAKGELFKKDLEIVAGARVAKKLRLKVGDTFYGAHGLVADDEMHAHKEYAYKVVGILHPTGTVLDALLLTNVSSVWRVHAEHDHDHEEELTDTTHNHDGHDHSHDGHDHSHDGHDHSHDGHDHSHDGHDHSHASADSLPPISPEGQEITAYLVVYKKDSTGNVSAMADQMVPRMIADNSEEMGVARPVRELQRLIDMTGMGSQMLQILAFVIIGISALSVFVSLYNSLKERRYELAIMRTMGASKGQIFLLIILEGLWLATIGIVVGFAVSHVGMSIVSVFLEEAYHYEFTGATLLKEEFLLWLLILLVGFFSALIPAIQAYRTDISDTLSQA